MMNRVKVLFFAADANSVLADGRTERLRLDEEIRRIQKAVRAAGCGDALEFDYLLAARIGDVLQALRERRPQIVHFSGHGHVEGIALLDREGEGPHWVRAEALVQLFRRFRGEIRVVILNACFSQPQAEAIAQAVGCAIGTRGEIFDDAAILFGEEFYRGIACGESVKTAFDDAQLAVSLERIEERDCPVLEWRPGVDPSQIVLVPKPLPPWRKRVVSHRAWTAAAAFAVGFGSGITDVICPDAHPEPTVIDLACGMRWGGDVPVATAATPPADPSSVDAIVEEAKRLYGNRKFAQAAVAFTHAANAGHPEAMTCLGDIYFHGRPSDPQPLLRLFDNRRGVEKDSVDGLHWLRKAASDEHFAPGMYALAVAYLSDATGRNDFVARDWFGKAAEQGHAEAMRRLGALQQQEKQYAAALDSYRRAVNSGSVDARVDLGLMYEQGLGAASDTAEALRLYRFAAVERSPRGMWAVGRVFELGIGVPRNYAQAAAWYRKAASAGHADAMRALASLYERGLGVRWDWFHARCWYERAEQAGAHHAAPSLPAS